MSDFEMYGVDHSDPTKDGRTVVYLDSVLPVIDQLRAQNGEWIPVSERLPDGTQWVLVYADGAINCMAWDRGGWRDWTDAKLHNIIPDAVTYWRPLPAPPIAGGEE